jgi:hypothetical protein
MKTLAAILMFSTVTLPFGCGSFPRRDLQPLVAAAGRYSIMRRGGAPAPLAVCANCRGAGKIGDGRVFVTCPVCNGTGKPKAAQKVCGPNGCPK